MLSRLKQLQADKKDDLYQPEMPPINGGEYLLAYLYEIGPVMYGGMGEAPLTHGELESWQRNTGIRLTPWEVRALRSLSLAHITASQAATEIDCKAPWDEADYVKEAPNRVALAMKEAVRKLAAT